MSESYTLLGRQRAVVLGDLVPGLAVRNVLLVIASATFVGVLAQISIPLGFTPVPITGQTLGVLLSGCALGWRRAGAALSLYLLAGMCGLPWFVHHSSGWQGPDSGYLLGFIAAALLTGMIAERGGDRRVSTALVAMIGGEVLIYLIAVPWLAVDLHVSLTKAIALGLTPFLAGDAIKAALASLILPGSWRILGEQQRPQEGSRP